MVGHSLLVTVRRVAVLQECREFLRHTRSRQPIFFKLCGLEALDERGLRCSAYPWRQHCCWQPVPAAGPLRIWAMIFRSQTIRQLQVGKGSMEEFGKTSPRVH